ncbi:MAG: hypothetical protein NC485_00275 [Ruminococcus flavefaciens]|nr:hypothetical protein [Ruminococcus flavefaciens]
MKWEQVTTMERLEMNGCAEQGAVLKYGEKVLVCGLTCRGFEAAVYEFIDDEEEAGLSYVECRINLRTTAPTPFDDGGDAIKWCFDHLND